ncbi:hypothetical protein [Flavobacterium sp.]|uniref:hypothetical protein n=1 Tax=Flavobacterium sp. TaxID=239 RepID=UPI0026389926|nr:hypothetical protein [Flavobacterium sp.]
MKDFKLDNEPKIKTGFQIPENYFEQFSEKVMTKLPNQEQKVISLWDRNKKWIYGAAAVIVLSLAIPLANQLQNTTQEETSEIENYLDYHSSLTSDDIIELLDEEDIAKIEVNNSIDNQTMEDEITENIDIENYITN